MVLISGSSFTCKSPLSLQCLQFQPVVTMHLEKKVFEINAVNIQLLFGLIEPMWEISNVWCPSLYAKDNFR